jgi:CBS domain containing-hemolysin-like protein
MTALFVAIGFTIGVSALCSILEAMILSTTTSEIESLKRSKPRLGELLEYYRSDLEETTSAILSLNTIANTLGATLVGGLAANTFGEHKLIYFSLGMTIGILIFSEVIPKNIGVIYRDGIQPLLIRPLQAIRLIMRPVSFLCKIAVFLVVPKRMNQDISDDDIRFLAEKSEKDGNLTQDERVIISNALSLDEIQIEEIMTPRTVVMAIEQSQSIKEVFESEPNLPFARIPVYKNNIDTITGVVRRRDLLKSKADDKDLQLVSDLMLEPIFVLGNRTAADALQLFLKKNQQLAIVLDEYGSVEGVITMEDVIEHILGREIFEVDDVAIDMREFAKLQNQQNQLHEN